MRRMVFGLAAVLAVLVGAGADAFGGVRTHRDDTGVPAAVVVDAAADDQTVGEGGEVTPVSDVPIWSPAPDAPITAGLIAGSPPDPAAATPPAPAGPGAGGGAAPAGCQQGEKQREVEVALGALGSYGPVIIDGLQSPTDCATILKFQQ